jgi:hypothetical protein
MIIYNVTTTISESIHDQWVTWMQERHIPEVLATGKFTSARLVKVLVGNENDEITYAVQYTTDSKEKLENIIRKMRRDYKTKQSDYSPINFFHSEPN